MEPLMTNQTIKRQPLVPSTSLAALCLIVVGCGSRCLSKVSPIVGRRRVITPHPNGVILAFDTMPAGLSSPRRITRLG